MSDFEHLRSKNCSSCGVRLDKVKKVRIRRVNDSTLCTKLNSVKNTILIKKDKQPNDTIIKIGDIVCGSCRSYAINLCNKCNIVALQSYCYNIIKIKFRHLLSSMLLSHN